MSICILSIGSELLEGSVIDSNSAFIANNLKRWGGKVELIRMVSDNKDEIVSLFQKYSKKFDIILTTGGLGPTFDDITAECLAESAGLSLELNEKAYNHMASCLNRAGVTIRQEHKHQSMLPATCRLFNNNVGTAMGFSVSLNKADIICMPGVPLEMKDMFIKEVLPFIVGKLGLKEQSYIDLHFLSIAESDIDVFIRSLNISNEVQCIINAGKGQVVVKLRGENKELVEDYALKIEKAFPKNFIGRGDILPTEYLVNLLKEKGKTISFAESCTGGMLSEMVTDISGASSVFYGSVVSYDNSIKENVLHVSADILNTYEPQKNRMQIINIKGCNVINDCYNSNPSALKNMLKFLSQRNENKKIAVIGDMLETETENSSYHKDIGYLINELKNIDVVIAVGNHSKDIYDIVNCEKYHFENAKNAIEKVKEFLNNDTAMLIKASLGMGFAAIIEAITNE